MANPGNINQNIPGANNLLSADQPLMTLNTQAIVAWMDTNHVDYAVADQVPVGSTFKAGKHNFVQMPIITTIVPNPGYTITGTGAGEVALFCQTSVLNPSVPALWLLKQNTLLANGIELSEVKTGSGASPAQTYSLFYLPCGLKVLIASIVPGVINAVPQAITFPVAFSTTPVGLFGQYILSGATPTISQALNFYNVSSTGFNVTAGSNFGSTTGMYYMAIGT